MAATEFYKAIKVPYNDQVGFDSEGRPMEFVNNVVASEHFIKLQDILAELTERSTELTNDVNNLEVHKDRIVRQIGRLRRKLFARNYNRITKTADKEIQDAFLRMIAEEAGELDELDQLEDQLEEVIREVEIRTPRLSEFKNDQKLIEKVGEYLKQYLDFEKLRLKIENRIG